jgi:hypothetical protein
MLELDHVVIAAADLEAAAVVRFESAPRLYEGPSGIVRNRVWRR